jgi:hypothetical protein
MKLPSIALLLSAVIWFARPQAGSAADSSGAPALKIFTEKQEAVIWVSVVAKVSFHAEGLKDGPANIPDREQKLETLATLIDVGGMAVTALSNIDPSRDLTGREIRTGSGTLRLEANAVLKEVKLILGDGTEIPSEVVMRDADLDLAFIKPREGSKELKGVKFQALDLKDAATANVTDDVVTLGRMDEVLNRAPSVTRGHITSVTRKPREFLRASGAAVGCPTFSVDGKLVGIAVSRSVRGKGSSTVIIPSGDVLEIAEQAKSARPAPVADRKPAKEDAP